MKTDKIKASKMKEEKTEPDKNPKLDFKKRDKEMKRAKYKNLLINLKDYTIVSSLDDSYFSKINIVQDKKTSNQYVAKTFKISTSQYHYNYNHNYNDNDNDYNDYSDFFNNDNDYNDDDDFDMYYQKEKEFDYLDDALSDYIFFLSRFQHPTIIKFIGFSPIDFSGERNPTILLKFAPKNSLDKVLNDIQHGLLELNDVFLYSGSIILIGIARSMMLLHKHHIIHGDLKPSNILIDENFYPYLTDFPDSIIFHGLIPYTPMYSAPEVLEKQQFSEKSDVYSFGIIMYEVISLKNPFQKLDKYEIKYEIKKEFHPDFDESFTPSLKNLIERCLSQNPNERPSFEEIFLKLAYDKDNYFDSDSQILDKILNYIDIIKSDLTFCKICQEKIDENDIVYYSGYPYHTKCVQCIECHKTLDKSSNPDDFYCITPGIFYCKEDYYTYIECENYIPKNHYKLYHDKLIENLAKEEFDTPCFKDENIVEYTPDEIFIDSDMIQNLYNKNNPYDIFIPNATLQFEYDPLKIDFNKLQNLIGDDVIILSVEQGCTFLKIAFLATRQLSNIETNFNDFLAPLIDKFHSTIGKSILGNMMDEPEISLPEKESIVKFCNKKSINLLQNTIELEEIELDYIKNEVNSILSEQKMLKDWSFVFSNESLFEEAEEQVRKDIENNAFEMIIVGQTVIANKYFEQYNSIKQQIPSNNYVERFLYHGSRLSNHQKIVKNHFLMPGVDQFKTTDDGYFGKGIYATENMFYAAVYGNGYSVLKVNEKTSIICCRSIYNSTKVKELTKLWYGKDILPEIANNYGINHALVGSDNLFEPITNEERKDNLIVAEEFVFPNKYQIIPICSFTVMRTDYFILWKDENITNNENSNYMKDLSKKIEINVYFKSSVDEALDLIRLKKHNKIKLITNGGHELTGKKLIQEARKIIGSNFLCFVFASNDRHLNWVLNMENVIFSTIPEVFKEFAELKMNLNDVSNFIRRLEENSHVHFRINQEELLKFPLTEKKDSFFNNNSNNANSESEDNSDSQNDDSEDDNDSQNDDSKDQNINLNTSNNDSNHPNNKSNKPNKDSDKSNNQLNKKTNDSNKTNNNSNKPDNNSNNQNNDSNKPNNDSNKTNNDSNNNSNKQENTSNKPNNDSNKPNNYSNKPNNDSNKPNNNSNKQTNNSNKPNNDTNDKPSSQNPNASLNNNLNEKEIESKDKRCEIF